MAGKRVPLYERWTKDDPSDSLWHNSIEDLQQATAGTDESGRPIFKYYPASIREIIRKGRSYSGFTSH